jgi:hypothetical protein
MIAEVGYDADSSKLYVKFLNGVTWEYDDVPESVFDGLIGGGSAGSYFRNNVRDSYDGREV